jgi:hypothetical protein
VLPPAPRRSASKPPSQASMADWTLSLASGSNIRRLALEGAANQSQHTRARRGLVAAPLAVTIKLSSALAKAARGIRSTVSKTAHQAASAAAGSGRGQQPPSQQPPDGGALSPLSASRPVVDSLLTMTRDPGAAAAATALDSVDDLSGKPSQLTSLPSQRGFALSSSQASPAPELTRQPAFKPNPRIARKPVKPVRVDTLQYPGSSNPFRIQGQAQPQQAARATSSGPLYSAYPGPDHPDRALYESYCSLAPAAGMVSALLPTDAGMEGAAEWLQEGGSASLLLQQVGRAHLTALLSSQAAQQGGSGSRMHAYTSESQISLFRACVSGHRVACPDLDKAGQSAAVQTPAASPVAPLGSGSMSPAGARTPTPTPAVAGSVPSSAYATELQQCASWQRSWLASGTVAEGPLAGIPSATLGSALLRRLQVPTGSIASQAVAARGASSLASEWGLHHMYAQASASHAGAYVGAASGGAGCGGGGGAASLSVTLQGIGNAAVEPVGCLLLGAASANIRAAASAAALEL